MKLSIFALCMMVSAGFVKAEASTLFFDSKLTTSHSETLSMYENCKDKVSPSYVDSYIRASSAKLKINISIGDLYSTSTVDSFTLSTISVLSAIYDKTVLYSEYKMTLNVNGTDYTVNSITGDLSSTPSFMPITFDFSSLGIQLSSQDKITATLFRDSGNVAIGAVMPSTGNTVSGAEFDGLNPDYFPVIQIAGTQSIPEPGSVTLATCGLAMFLLRRRRVA